MKEGDRTPMTSLPGVLVRWGSCAPGASKHGPGSLKISALGNYLAFLLFPLIALLFFLRFCWRRNPPGRRRSD